jgi:hypothetical protein
MALPATLAIALTPQFVAMKTTTWSAFLRRNGLSTVEMTAALDAIRSLAWPVMEAAVNSTAFNQSWTPGKGWNVP